MLAAIAGLACEVRGRDTAGPQESFELGSPRMIRDIPLVFHPLCIERRFVGDRL
jgi:hypothetical protein